MALAPQCLATMAPPCFTDMTLSFFTVSNPLRPDANVPKNSVYTYL